MTPASSPQITELLQAWSAGNQSAVGQIVELVYPELHQMARKHLYHERPEHSIQATALVNEAYLRLVNIRRVQWKDRAHFLAIGARIMRRILIDYARARPRVQRTELTETLAIGVQKGWWSVMSAETAASVLAKSQRGGMLNFRSLRTDPRFVQLKRYPGDLNREGIPRGL